MGGQWSIRRLSSLPLVRLRLWVTNQIYKPTFEQKHREILITSLVRHEAQPHFPGTSVSERYSLLGGETVHAGPEYPCSDQEKFKGLLFSEKHHSGLRSCLQEEEMVGHHKMKIHESPPQPPRFFSCYFHDGRM